jgi:hypothetical protein
MYYGREVFMTELSALWPNEDKLRDAVRPLGIPPGDYVVPRESGREWRTPEFAEKMKAGPVMIVTVLPNGPWSMGRNTGLWFLYLAVVWLWPR